MAHILSVVFLTLSLHLIDRQVNYLIYNLRYIDYRLFKRDIIFLFVLTYMELYLGRIFEQIRLSMETTIDAGTGRSFSYEKC